IDGTFGGATTLPGKPDVMQQMLDYVDQLELLCRATFSSELGAPVPAADGEIATAEASCDAAHVGTLTTMVFASTDNETRVYYFEGEKMQGEKMKVLRDRIAQTLK